MPSMHDMIDELNDIECPSYPPVDSGCNISAYAHITRFNHLFAHIFQHSVDCQMHNVYNFYSFLFHAYNSYLPLKTNLLYV